MSGVFNYVFPYTFNALKSRLLFVINITQIFSSVSDILNKYVMINTTYLKLVRNPFTRSTRISVFIFVLFNSLLLINQEQIYS